MLLKEQGARMNLGGGKGRDHIIIDGKTQTPNTKGTESRDVQADVRGTGSNHPIMDKLGVLEARPTDRL